MEFSLTDLLARAAQSGAAVSPSSLLLRRHPCLQILPKFPHVVETGKVLATIGGDGFGRCELVYAFLEMTKVMREPIYHVQLPSGSSTHLWLHTFELEEQTRPNLRDHLETLDCGHCHRRRECLD